MKQKKDLSIINCIATSLLAVFFSIPVHEVIHLITFYAYGDQCEYYAATSVNYLGLIDYYSLPTFHRIMATGLVSALRIVLSVVGIGGTVSLFFILNHMSYYFIEDPNDKAQRMGVAVRLYLMMLIVGVITHFATWAQNPGVRSGATSFAFSCLTVLIWIPFFWGFMFTGVMKVCPPKKSRFLYKLPEKPNYILLAAGVILILVDIFVFGPGIFFH